MAKVAGAANLRPLCLFFVVFLLTVYRAVLFYLSTPEAVF